MSNLILENALINAEKKLENQIDMQFITLYSDFNNNRLCNIFSTLHALITKSFNTMNSRLPTNEHGSHFKADDSRELLFAIETSEALLRSLSITNYVCEIEAYYKELFTNCKLFLVKSGGSSIPPKMDQVNLYYTMPIFINQNSIKTKSAYQDFKFELKHIGDGSYANVFKYKDKYYDEYFALKRAKKNLDDKEKERFQREFKIMKELSSPYILNVFGYSQDPLEYTMEFMDYTLQNYISKYNDKLSMSERQTIISQFLKGLEYIYSKQILHRDLSPKNILVKSYEHILVIKISDFGLVKVLNSDLTSENTDVKGQIRDPLLTTDGFENYSFEHEVYAITIIILYILTGSLKASNIVNQNIKSFVEKGLNPDKSLRYKDIEEIRKAVSSITNI